jgi:chemotaxis protein CheX
MNSGAVPTKLTEIADKVWRMVLGSRLTPVARDSNANCQGLVLASVTITGAWNGVLTIGCSLKVARRAASIMFGKPEDAAAEEDMRDALGELTNMVGGNFKTLLKGDCRLSVPKVVDQVPNDHVVPKPVTHQWFECNGGFVLLHLFKETAAA